MKAKFLFILSILPMLSIGEEVKLAWNFNAPEEQVSEYIIAYGTASGQLNQNQSVSGTTNTATVYNLTAGITYYFAIKAKNIIGESPLSAEISHFLVDSPFLSKTDWILTVSSEETKAEDNRKENAIDGNPNTYWHSKWSGVSYPQLFTVNLGKLAKIRGVVYLPLQDASPDGSIKNYKIQVSQEGQFWTELASGTFAFTISEKTVLFPETQAQYVRLVATSDYSNSSNGWAAIAEFKVLGDYLPPLAQLTAPEDVIVEEIK